MVRKTVELFECDMCGQPGDRYTITFPDEGMLALDRCEKHSRKISALREEKGTWAQAGSTRSVFKVSSVEDIQKQRKR
jgi:ribosome maturation factor RimP